MPIKSSASASAAECENSCRVQKLTVLLPGGVRIDHLARSGKESRHVVTRMLYLQRRANACGG